MKITLQRSIPEDKTLRELDTPEIQEQTANPSDPVSQAFTVSVGGVTYTGTSRAQLMETVSKIRRSRIRTQHETLEVHEANGIFRTLGPDGMMFQANTREQLIEMVSRFYPVLGDAEAETTVDLNSLPIKENKIGPSNQTYSATIDGVTYTGTSREQLLEIISVVHPVVRDMDLPEQHFYNVVFHPREHPLK
jgi:hypothetical protein